MAEWTIEEVAERLEEAASVLRRLPEARVRGHHNGWPAMLSEFADLVGREPEPLRPGPPSAAAIGRMEEALRWLRWLEPELGQLVWARAERMRWKAICYRFGISRATANRRRDYALGVIAWRLNGRAPHLRRGRRYVVERARA